MLTTYCHVMNHHMLQKDNYWVQNDDFFGTKGWFLSTIFRYHMMISNCRIKNIKPYREIIILYREICFLCVFLFSCVFFFFSFFCVFLFLLFFLSRLRCWLFVAKPIYVAKKTIWGLKMFFFFSGLKIGPLGKPCTTPRFGFERE